jgi:replicative DNA helicase
MKQITMLLFKGAMDMSKTELERGEERGAAGQRLSDCASLFTREEIGSVSAERVPTGFPALDRSLNGGLFNGLFVLGAVPGLGKSTLALQIANNLSGRGYPVLYFALEMNRAWITAKALCRTDFALHRQPSFQAADLLKMGKQFTDQEWERINQARELVERDGRNLYLYEQGPELTHIGQIRQHIRAFRERYRAEGGTRPILVVVDYLQILTPRDASLKFSDKQIVDDNIRELCAIRDQEQVMILLISALNRSSYNREISLESFKESGSIEYSADVILGMQYQGMQYQGEEWPKGKNPFSLEEAKARNPRKLELTLLKMRYGQDGVRIPLEFYSGSSYFQEPEGTEQMQPARIQELREKFGAWPVQYHDGFHQKARRLRG